MSRDMTNQVNDGPDNEELPPTRRNADRAMAETCPDPDTARRTRSGRSYSAPD